MPRAFWIAISAAVGLLIVLLLLNGKAHAGGFVSTSCNGSRHGFGCMTFHGNVSANPRTIHVPADINEADREAHARKWEEFCKPTEEVDKYGVIHLRYSHDGCEFGRTQ